MAGDLSLPAYVINKVVAYVDGTTDLVFFSFQAGTPFTQVGFQSPTVTFGISNQFLTIGGQSVISIVDLTSIDVPLGLQVMYSSGVLSYGLPSTPTITNYFFFSRLGVLYQFGSTDICRECRRRDTVPRCQCQCTILNLR